MGTNIEKRKDKKGVVIREDKYGIEVLTMRNGYQWSGMPMDEELLDMLQEAIAEFKAKRANATSHRSAACGASGGLPGCTSAAATEDK